MKTRTATDRIIYHHSLSMFGDADLIRQWHVGRGFFDIGYHYVIPIEGPFRVGRKLQLMGSHALGKNSDSIGVCFIGDFRQAGPTDHQINEAARMYHGLCRSYDKRLKCEFHHETCPGPLLDREAFLKTLEESL